MATPYANNPVESMTFTNTAHTSVSRELEELLLLLHEHFSKVPTLVKFVKERSLIPSTLFTSASISACVEALDGSVDLTSDCIIFSDLTRLYSFNYFSDTEGFYSIIRNILMSGRTLSNNKQPLYKSATNDFYFSDSEQLRNFLLDNELLIVIYVVSMIEMILGED